MSKTNASTVCHLNSPPTFSDDPFCIVIEDQVVEGEQRFWAFGRLQNLVVIVVVHTHFELTVEGDLEEGARIISARKATPLERRFYEEETE
jgi:uncharacterized protein